MFRVANKQVGMGFKPLQALRRAKMVINALKLEQQRAINFFHMTDRAMNREFYLAHCHHLLYC
jgi:hypothetical protein